MTPPPYIPMANGLAQSVVSLARFIGPLTGGVGKLKDLNILFLVSDEILRLAVWSKSIANGPEVSHAAPQGRPDRGSLILYFVSYRAIISALW